MDEVQEGSSFQQSPDNNENGSFPKPDVIQNSMTSPPNENDHKGVAKGRILGPYLEAARADVLHRSLSHGDDPLWLNKANDDTDDQDFMLGRNKYFSKRKILMTEVVPSHAKIIEDKSWKLPIELFKSKKNVDASKKSKRIRSYYKAQDELISSFEGVLEDGEPNTSSSNQDNYQKSLMFSKLTLLINLMLLIAKAVASALSGSIAIISSLVDSSLDLFSGVIMWWATRAVKQSDHYNYPQGRSKLEPVAVIILSVVMSLCSLQLIRESIEKIITLIGHESTLPNVDYVTFAIAGSTVLIKLILWLVCRRVNSPIIQALAQDHRNDVLSNSVAIICGYLGSQNFISLVNLYNFSYVDPVGAIIISLYIMFNWYQTGSEQIKMLTGHAARPDFLSKITWICLNHHPKIEQIDTVRAFHFGSNFLVEVDIVLADDTPLHESHDIGESLQRRLESMEEVERAFVHLDFESSHRSVNEHKSV